MFPTDRPSGEWAGPKLVATAACRLLDEFSRLFPEASSIAHGDPVAALDRIPALEVEWTTRPPAGACQLGGTYDGRRSPALIRIREERYLSRNNFTAMHELGHHLLYLNETWQYDVLPGLGGRARIVEEKIVNAFAAKILIPDSAIDAFLGHDVTPQGVFELADATSASLTACCIAALGRPGDRLVLIGDPDGRVSFADSNGHPYNPGRKLPQPLLARAAERAGEKGRSTMKGGEGIRYSSGRAYTDVEMRVAVRGAVVVAVVTTTPPDGRIHADAGWGELCGNCGTEFVAANSPGYCQKCGQWKCPACRTCGCAPQPAICTKCFQTLSVEDMARGRSVHEECP